MFPAPLSLSSIFSMNLWASPSSKSCPFDDGDLSDLRRWEPELMGHGLLQCGRLCWGLMSPYFELFFEITGFVSSRLKRKKDHPDCCQRKVRKPAAVMVWEGVSVHGLGHLHICEGTVNAERCIQVLGQHVTIQTTSLSGTFLLISARKCQAPYCLFVSWFNIAQVPMLKKHVEISSFYWKSHYMPNHCTIWYLWSQFLHDITWYSHRFTKGNWVTDYHKTLDLATLQRIIFGLILSHQAFTLQSTSFWEVALWFNVNYRRHIQNIHIQRFMCLMMRL